MTAHDPISFVPVTVHKRDAFSETVSGHAADAPARKLVLRKLDALPWWGRPLAWMLARREIRGLRAVQGIAGVPELVRVDREGLLRSWTEGTPLQLARPDDAAWYADARRMLREMRARGVTHNDLAKPQNWLRTPDGRAAVIDFQLASVHRRRGRLFRVQAYEDLRHLLKQKRFFAPHLLTPTERRIVGRRSLPSRLWRRTGKRAYVFVTRRLMNWSDGEGTGRRLEDEGPAILSALRGDPAIRDAALCAYPLPSQGVGLYAFVETELDEAGVRARLPESASVEAVQAVATLPRTHDGAPRRDILEMVAMNRLEELSALEAREPDLAPVIAPIVAHRRNLTDRYFRAQNGGGAR
ncbi:hypothetical protein SAMN04490244_109121 [Tranquillimonas rosea]|uniref:Serine/threonine protein kinase n=1 Tax=Tranquillimonas rosea TaxID=641238 RepID=A0A1H9W633_9RHOB|nr:serine/threonine protein kinase [Tranquillimonas rosea]SES29348.1 hypothetical protein SAMN04490244_109121 [Tranquillimonas rosea]